MNETETDDGPMGTEEFIEQLEQEGGDKLAWWLREFKIEYTEGLTPRQAANDIYFKVEEPSDISLLLGSAVMFGVLWEKEDNEPYCDECGSLLATDATHGWVCIECNEPRKPEDSD